MCKYQFVFLDSNGRKDISEDVECKDDAHAFGTAMTLLNRGVIEIWQTYSRMAGAEFRFGTDSIYMAII